MNCMSFATGELFDFSSVRISKIFNLSVDASLTDVKKEGNTSVFIYSSKDKGLSSFLITAKQIRDTVLFSIDLSFNKNILGSNLLRPENCFQIPFGKAVPDEFTANANDGNIWWRYPSFGTEYEQLPDHVQGLFARFQNLHCHVQPLLGNEFVALLDRNGLCFSVGSMNVGRLSGPFLAVTISKDPITAVTENFVYARGLDGIRVPLRSERRIPTFMDSFGWCTWDAFRTDVSEKLIFEKLDEFRIKNIPVRYVIIDDGWQSVENNELVSFEADPVKFPNGLKACIERMKREYGIHRVGVWHAFTGGYWAGVKEDSAVFKQQKDHLIKTASGHWLQNPDPEIGFLFWDSFHSYLEASGVDFVKVDNQSSAIPNMCGFMPPPEALPGLHEGLERSVRIHFHGDIINCMGMDMVDVLSRPMSGLSRNSDDFYPHKTGSFAHHLVQNLYNALWHGQVMHCDFDMWWSDHPDAVLSAVLRAVSGSPVYVSDGIGGSAPEELCHIYESDGSLPLFDGPALPTLDLIYTDCISRGIAQKLWNRCEDSFVLATFQLDSPAEEIPCKLSVIPGLDEASDYYVEDVFSKDTFILRVNDIFTISFKQKPVALYHIYPVLRDSNGSEYVRRGTGNTYGSIASESKEILRL